MLSFEMSLKGIRLQESFRSVVVITAVSHTAGPQFEPGRKQIMYLWTQQKSSNTNYVQFTVAEFARQGNAPFLRKSHQF